MSHPNSNDTTHGVEHQQIDPVPALTAAGVADPFPHIPLRLKFKRQWLLWRREPRLDKDGNWTSGKYEKKPTRWNLDKDRKPQNAAINRPEHFLTYEEACAFYLKRDDLKFPERNPTLCGIGFSFYGQKRIKGLDLDNIFEADGLTIKPHIKEWLDYVPSYVEESQSGEGAHVIYEDSTELDLRSGKRHDQGVEAFNGTGYFAVTGNILVDYEDRDELVDCHHVLERVAKELVNPAKGARIVEDAPPGSGWEKVDVTTLGLSPEALQLIVKGSGPLWDRVEDKSGAESLLSRLAALELARVNCTKGQIASVLSDKDYACSAKALKNRRGVISSAFQWAYRYQAAAAWAECTPGFTPVISAQERAQESPGEAKPLPSFLAPVEASQAPQAAPQSFMPVGRPPPESLPFKLVRDCFVNLEQEELIEGLVGQRTVVVVYGPPGSGKSYLTIDAAMHIAAGRQWHGRDVEQGGVVYIAAEACESVNMRVHAFKRVILEDEHADLPMIVVQTNINLLKEVDEAYDDYDEIDRLLATIGAATEQRQLGPIRLVVLDTLAACMPGANENDSAVMTRVTAAAARITEEIGAAAMILHHPVKDPAGRGRGGRGHGSLQGAITSEILVEKIDQGEAGNLHTVTVTKQRDLPDTTRFGFRLKVVEMGHTARRCKRVSACVVEPCEFTGKAIGARDLTDQQRLTLRCLNTVLETDGRAPTEEELAANPETLEVGQKVVSKEVWKARATAEGVSEATAPGADGKPKNPSRPFNRCVTALKNRNRIHEWNGVVWLHATGVRQGNGADPAKGEAFGLTPVLVPVGSPEVSWRT